MEIKIVGKKKKRKINKSKGWFSEKIGKIDKPLVRLIRQRGRKKDEKENTQITNIKNERGNIITDSTAIKVIRENHEQLYAN